MYWGDRLWKEVLVEYVLYIVVWFVVGDEGLMIISEVFDFLFNDVVVIVCIVVGLGN